VTVRTLLIANPSCSPSGAVDHIDCRSLFAYDCRAFVMLSLALDYWVSPYWYLFTGFVGLNLFQYAFTNWCPMMTILRKSVIKES